MGSTEHQKTFCETFHFSDFILIFDFFENQEQEETKIFFRF